MITRKLAVPLINEKVLQQAEHCYLVTSSVSDAAFDFVRSRISPKCKIDLVTGLDHPVSPNVLRRILNNYAERISVRIYTRSAVNANMYMFDLPFRKTVAYIGSGGLTMEGLKDQEEIFWKVTNPKEIESLLSWFTGFYEFGIPLSAQVVDYYEPVYYAMRNRDVSSLREKESAIASASVNWDAINFRNQFFKRKDYESLKKTDNDVSKVHEKLRQLQDEVKLEMERNGLFPVREILADAAVPGDESHLPHTVWISFSRSASGFNPGFMRIDIGLTSSWFFIRLHISGGEGAKKDRSKLIDHLMRDSSRQRWFSALSALKRGYALEVAGKRKPVETFASDIILLDWLKNDDMHLYPVILERRFMPGDTAIRLDTIMLTIPEEVLRISGVLAASSD